MNYASRVYEASTMFLHVVRLVVRFVVSSSGAEDWDFSDDRGKRVYMSREMIEQAARLRARLPRLKYS